MEDKPIAVVSEVKPEPALQAFAPWRGWCLATTAILNLDYTRCFCSVFFDNIALAASKIPLQLMAHCRQSVCLDGSTKPSVDTCQEHVSDMTCCGKLVKSMRAA